MGALNAIRTLRVLILCIIAIAVAACGRMEDSTMDSVEATESAKVPITTSSEEALESYLAGRALLEDLHFTEARPHFEQAVEFDPEFAMAYVQLANSAQTAAQFFTAVGNADAFARGASEGEQLIIKALIEGSRNDPVRQVAALTELLGLHPDDERVHNQLGNFYSNRLGAFSGQSDFERAVRHYKKAVAINPAFATAYNSMGYAHRFNNDLASARGAFEKYVELIPDEANPYDSYAELLMEMGQYDESIENYRKSLSIDRNFAASYAGISINESLRGDSDSALEAAAQMLSVARTSGEKQTAMFRKVTSHLFAGDTQAALSASEEMYALAEADSNDAAMGGIREYMGDIMLAEGDGTKALAFFESALDHRQKADINDANKAQAKRTHLFKTAIVAIVNDDVEMAADLAAKYKNAAEENGTSFERRRIHEHAGYIAIMKDDNATAMAELALANDLDPIVLYWCAVAHKNAGNNEKAREFAERAVNRNTISANLPFFREEAMAMLNELSGR